MKDPGVLTAYVEKACFQSRHDLFAWAGNAKRVMRRRGRAAGWDRITWEVKRFVDEVDQYQTLVIHARKSNV